MSGELFVNSLYGNPVKGAIKLAETNNPLYGYYGFVRTTKDGKPLFHHGFDYCAEEGTEVYAVATGKIIQIRIGKWFKGTCAQKKVFESSNNKTLLYFDKDVCNKKCNKGCYGIQVWLQLTNKKCAFYAHLSRLNGKAFNNVAFVKVDSITYKPQEGGIIIHKGDKIGESGRTGNACDEKDVPVPHLHFECRKGIEKGAGTKSPNAIVLTGFDFIDNDGIWSNEFTKEDKKAFDNSRKKIKELENTLIKEGYGEKNSKGEFEVFDSNNFSSIENIRVQSLLGQIQRESSIYKPFPIDQLRLI